MPVHSFQISIVVFELNSVLAAFGLMFLYFKYLNMFETIRYLALISIPLFIFGHRVLATLAARR